MPLVSARRALLSCERESRSGRLGKRRATATELKLIVKVWGLDWIDLA